MPILKNNQDEYKFYLNQLSVTTGQITDLEKDFLFKELAVTSGATKDLWMLYLKANGATSDNFMNAWKEFLTSEGYTVVNLQDTQILYFKNNS